MQNNDVRAPFHLSRKDDINIYLLHFLMTLGEPVDLVTFNDIAIADSFISQIDLIDCLFDLVHIGAVAEREENGKKLYSITKKGKDVAQTLESTLFPEIRAKSTRTALQYRVLLHRGSKVQSHIEDLPDGRARVVCSLCDAQGVYMETALVFSTHHQASLIKYHFDENPEFIYRGMLGLYSGEVNYLIPEEEP